MDTKWKNTPDQGGRGLKLRAVCAFLAFFFSIGLLAEGGLFFWANLSSSGGRQWMEDSFQQDWQSTQQFRNHISNYMETLIAMGAGGRAYSGYYDNYHYGWGADGSGRTWADARHDWMKQDENLLYTVSVGGIVKYTNREGLSDSTAAAALPEGYDLLLQFDGERVQAWKGGAELELYGDGYYTEESGWYLPGYKNFTVSEAAAQVRVTMAVIERPQIFIRGNYDADGTRQYNELYYLKASLDGFRENVLIHLARMGAGAALLVIYLVLRRDKKRADQALARGTGKVWFEAKLLAFLVLLALLLPMPEYLREVWSEVSYAGTGKMSAISDAAISNLTGVELEQLMESGAWEDYGQGGGLSVAQAVTILTSEGGWLLREYVTALADYPVPLLAIFWAFYLLICNDWRYNKKPWRHGICGMLCAGELKYPLQKRLSRMNGALGLVLFLLLGETLSFLILLTLEGTILPPWAIWNFFLIPLVLTGAVYGWFFSRQRKLWSDLGAVSDQIALLRAGQVDSPLDIPSGSDLHQMADDLNHVRQGLHQAVEERTRSERMKVELVTNVSHDLKTPLTSIISYTELLAQEPLEPPASEYVQILGEKSQRLRAMVQDVFEVSKATSGQLPVKLERLDFGRLLRQTLADMEQAIGDSGLTLRASIPEEGAPIIADSDRLYRVFQNLIGNALKYSLPGSRVYLSLAVEGDAARASVQNTSATELRARADYTGRFVRGDESRSDGGSGLGLSIADSFTTACGGRLDVVTQADLFTASVTFPLAQDG